MPIKVETWIFNINEKFIENLREELVKFSTFLANNDIIIDFKLANVGMDQNYNAKYFLNLDFEVDRTINKGKLKSAYIRDIYNIFMPYIEEDRDVNKSPVEREDSSIQSSDFNIIMGTSTKLEKNEKPP